MQGDTVVIFLKSEQLSLTFKFLDLIDLAG